MHRYATIALGAAMVLLASGRPAVAGGGALDTSFSGDGKLTTDLGFDEFEEDVAAQSDGKIVVVAKSSSGDFVAARYHPDGSLDATFDGDGMVTFAISPTARSTRHSTATAR